MPGTNIRTKNDLNKLTVKWLLVSQMFFDVFSSENQAELPEGTDLSTNKSIKPPGASDFLNEFELANFDCPCLDYGSVCNKEQFMAEILRTKKLELGEKVDSAIDKTTANKHCLVMLEEYSKFRDRYNLICSTNII